MSVGRMNWEDESTDSGPSLMALIRDAFHTYDGEVPPPEYIAKRLWGAGMRGPFTEEEARTAEAFFQRGRVQPSAYPLLQSFRSKLSQGSKP